MTTVRERVLLSRIFDYTEKKEGYKMNLVYCEVRQDEEYEMDVVTALVPGWIVEVYEASGRHGSPIAHIEAGEEYVLDHMLSRLGNWDFLPD